MYDAHRHRRLQAERLRYRDQLDHRRHRSERLQAGEVAPVRLRRLLTHRLGSRVEYEQRVELRLEAATEHRRIRIVRLVHGAVHAELRAVRHRRIMDRLDELLIPLVVLHDRMRHLLQALALTANITSAND